MSLSRRFLLFSPLVTLTLFFAALGWRNWHLPMNADDVFAAIPAYYRTPIQKSTDALNLASGFGPSPFVDNAITVLSLKNGLTATPISDSLLARLKRDCPKARLVNFSPSVDKSQCQFAFVEVRFVNPFQAKCVVSKLVKALSSSQREEMFETFILKRSPVNFRNSGWRLERSTAIGNTRPRI